MTLPLQNNTHEPAPSFTRVAPYYDELMKDVPYQAWAGYVMTLARRQGCFPERILELACGTATISLLLAKHGYELVGLDGSAAMLEVAQKKIEAVGADIQLVHSDLRSYEIPGVFELAICLYDSLNNILEPDGLQSAFESTRRALAPGGIFIFDLNTEFALRSNLFTQENMRPQAVIQYRWVSRYDYPTRIATVDMQFWVGPEGQREAFSEIHQQRAYSLEELERLLESAGFSLVAAYDGLSFRPPNKRTDRLYCVARPRE